MVRYRVLLLLVLLACAQPEAAPARPATAPPAEPPAQVSGELLDPSPPSAAPERPPPIPVSERTPEELARVRQARSDLWREGHVRAHLDIADPAPVDGATYPAASLHRQLRGRISHLRACYERALRDDSAIEGTMEIEISVPPEGAADSMRVVSDQLDSEGLVSCVTERLTGISWPDPPAAVQVFRVRLTFQPDVPEGYR
ncbi:MAG: hypothetical protein DRJ42_19410 [Deltaproteobacteria bacterium]|nr:MAG: hypothetical protein DRJ42_19410 [Deltaproteobacteria bacterium]